MGTLSRKTAPHQNCVEQDAAQVGAGDHADHGDGAPRGHRLAALLSSNTVIRIDSVLGMRSEPPTPISARAAMSCHGLGGQGGQQRGAAEQRQPDDQEAAPAEAVGQAAGGQQQPGEHQDVGVDDPLDVRRARRPGRHRGRGWPGSARCCPRRAPAGSDRALQGSTNAGGRGSTRTVFDVTRTAYDKLVHVRVEFIRGAVKQPFSSVWTREPRTSEESDAQPDTDRARRRGTARRRGAGRAEHAPPGRQTRLGGHQHLLARGQQGRAARTGPGRVLRRVQASGDRGDDRLAARRDPLRIRDAGGTLPAPLGDAPRRDDARRRPQRDAAHAAG